MGLTLNTPIYLNKSLILDLYSVLIDGYLESKSIKCVNDKTDILKVQGEHRNEKENECNVCKSGNEKKVEKEIEICNSCGFSGSIDDRNSNSKELSIKKVYTIFYFFHNLRNIMINKNMLNYIKDEDIINKSVKCGDYVEFEGSISNLSITNQINNLIDIIDMYDPKSLDNLLKNKDNVRTNYSVILKQLKNLNGYLNTNSTTNMIMNLKVSKAILNININNFSDKNAHMYDNANSSCKTLCKVVKVSDENDYVDLLSKTGMHEYYNEFLEYIKPHLDLLSKNGIIVPKNFTTKVNGPCIQAIPIAMYV